MAAGHRQREARRAVLVVALMGTVLLAGCLGGSDDQPTDSSTQGPITLTVWHTFAAESKEENVFLQSIRAFDASPQHHGGCVAGSVRRGDQHLHDRNRWRSPGFDAPFGSLGVI